MSNGKVTLQHRQRSACIYIRQSTPGQLRLNTQSTERQYRFKDKALELGWAASKIRVLDRDLGISGSSMSQREDFKELVSGVSMGQVGGVYLKILAFHRVMLANDLYPRGKVVDVGSVSWVPSIGSITIGS